MKILIFVFFNLLALIVCIIKDDKDKEKKELRSDIDFLSQRIDGAFSNIAMIANKDVPGFNKNDPLITTDWYEEDSEDCRTFLWRRIGNTLEVKSEYSVKDTLQLIEYKNLNIVHQNTYNNVTSSIIKEWMVKK